MAKKKATPEELFAEWWPDGFGWEEDEKNWVKDNNPDGTCWKKLRDLFALDYHRNNAHYPILSTDPNDDTEFQNRVVEYFRGRGYKLRVRRPRGGDSVHIKLMKYWLEVPRDLAMKIMVLGEVPDHIGDST